ncbi:universal stress protein [Arthrobacter sp. Z4-13]|jgi:nucleotide-binding universal stress UspA family protein
MNNPEAKIVVGVDGSDSSVQALRLAARLAPALNARIHAVACWDFPQIYAGYVPPDFEAFEAAATHTLAESLGKAFGPDASVDITQEIVRGPAPAKLVEAGADATMLVVGRRGHGGFIGMHLGSVSSACVSHAACPVLVVHADGSHRPHHLWRGSKGKDAAKL